MKPVSIIIVSSVTASFVFHFFEIVFANETKDKLQKMVNSDKLLDENKKLVNKINEQIIGIRNHLKNKKHKAVDNYLHLGKKAKKVNFTLSSQLEEAKKNCWNVRLVNSRMINGTTPIRDSSTWMVAIFQDVHNPNKTTKFICGGCLISSWYVLTAARCFLNATRYWYAKEYHMLSVRYGMHDLSSQVYSETGVLKIHIHPDYWNVKAFFGDIALVKLKKTIKYTNVISPICIPYLNTPNDWTYLRSLTQIMISSWGRTAPDNWILPKISVNLQKGVVDVVKPSECKEGFAKKINYNISATICVGAKPNEAKICEGDTGSPGVAIIPILGNPSVELPVIVGIVSEGDKKCGGNYLLTNVAIYKEWINKMTDY